MRLGIMPLGLEMHLRTKSWPWNAFRHHASESGDAFRHKASWPGMLLGIMSLTLVMLPGTRHLGLGMHLGIMPLSLELHLGTRHQAL